MAVRVGHAVRGLIGGALAAAALAACSSAAPAPSDPLRAYLESRDARRATLERSLVAPANGYSQLRLSRYATGRDGDWERLAEWNPRTEPVRASDLGRGEVSLGADAAALELARAEAGDAEALRALGERAFYSYPVQLIGYAGPALESREAALRYGLWIDERERVGGLVRAEAPAGGTAVGLTCSSCHARVEGGKLRVLPNTKLDLGRLMTDAGGDSSGARLAWGPGRIDVSSAAGTEPVRIPDLRPVRYLGHLHHAGAVKQNDVTTLAVRLETLIIVSHGQARRPPRAVTLGLALYLWQLADELPAPPPAPGAFARTCGGCHAGEALGGGLVPMAQVGTDETVGRSADRGTGFWRVPSLRGAGSRGPLMHDASILGVDALLDPSRAGGHRFGLDLAEEERAALAAWLRAL